MCRKEYLKTNLVQITNLQFTIQNLTLLWCESDIEPPCYIKVESAAYVYLEAYPLVMLGIYIFLNKYFYRY